jgi:hypothetical protein
MSGNYIFPLRKLFGAIALILAVSAGQVFAGDIMVDADCSLPNAILSGNEEEMIAPQADCEAGDADDGNSQVGEDGVEIPAGLDTITIDVSGTVDGVITLEATLTISSNIVIEGGGFTIEGAGNQIFNVIDGALTAKDLTMNGGWSESNGGAIAVTNAAITLNNSVVSSSGAKELGGGIYALDSDLRLIDSVVSDNATGVVDKPEPQLPDTDGDSGESAKDDNSAQAAESADSEPSAQATEPITWDTFGGGIYFEGADSTLIIDKSGLDTNVSPSNGGGLYIASGSATISNSTISSNVAGGDGGAVYNTGGSALTHVTIVHNVAENTGGIVDTSMMLLYNSILADNIGGDCSGTLNATIGNLIRDLSCSHDGLSGDPNLLLLGGSPAYYLPQVGSPALDFAYPEYCLLTDQRGIDRAPESCDIGAAEYEPGVFTFQIQSALAILSPPDSGGGVETDEEAQATPEPALPPTPAPSICSQMPPNIIISGYQNNTGCKVADDHGVGNKTLIDHGFYHAVDIFGDLSSPVKVCFQHDPGIIILLDAANSPRNIVPLSARLEDGMVCADVTRAGTVVLMPLAFSNSGLVPASTWELSGCTVTTTAILNLRSESNSTSSVIGNVLNDVQLAADRKENNYYRVNYYQIIGWLSSDYLSKSGNCA